MSSRLARPFALRLPGAARVGLGLALAAGAIALGTAGAQAAGPAAGGPLAAHAPSRRASRVVIISEDGLRGDVLTQLHLPWHESLYKNGSYSWRARTIRTASTLPSHAAMLSGQDVKAHGLDWNNWKPNRGYIKVPTIFERAEEHGLKGAMFVGKFKLRHLAKPGTVDVFERPGYLCKKVAEDAAEYLVKEKPPLSFIHFSNPDEAGHSKGWESPEYYKAVEEDDRCLGIIVSALRASGLDEDTLIIISADHGGHSHMHSGALSVDREIPWIAHGPGVRAGYRIQGSISTLDTAATALDALGLPVPDDVAGKPVREIYLFAD